MSGWAGLLPLLAGIGLLAAPWWSSTLASSDYPLVVVLGTVFAGIGAAVCVPDSWPRLRSLAFTMFSAAFGTICAAIALAPRHAAADGTLTIGGVAGFAIYGAVPWWARAVAGAFALLFLFIAAAGVWGLLRSLVRNRN